MKLVMVQDKIVDSGSLSPIYFDRGIYFGDGVYEVLRSYNGKIFALDDHLERLEHSLNAIEIKGISIETVKDRINFAFQTAKIPNAKIYLHITRGSGERNHSWSEDIVPNFFLTLGELEDSAELKKKGVKVSTYPDLRWKRCDIKSLNLLPNVLAKQDADKKGCYEAILVNEAGFITEGAGSAFFAIFGNTLRTTPLGSSILPSITRKFVLQAAMNINMQIIEQSITPADALNADELFMAVTTKDIIAIVQFDGKQITSGKPGPLTQKLTDQFKTFIA